MRVGSLADFTELLFSQLEETDRRAMEAKRIADRTLAVRHFRAK
jgi:hypothetical protein